MTFQEIFDACQKAAQRSATEPTSWSINRETYDMWRANLCNAKARRRWRRRNIPNSQRLS